MGWPFVRFGRQVQADVPPPGVLDNAHYAATPGARNSEAARYVPGDVPSLDDEYFPTIAKQDAVLTHWDRPPAAENPQAWYEDRNVWLMQQTKLETLDATPEAQSTARPGDFAPNPNWIPAAVTRWTAFLSPSSWRYERPFDREVTRTLNGIHSSLADNHTAYELRGQAGQNIPWNNSYRIDPVSNDASAVFVGDTVADSGHLAMFAVQDNVFGSKSYRLGG